MDPNELYQLLIVHDEQGARLNLPYYDLGVLKGLDAVQLAANIAAVAAEFPMHEGPVGNILEAWASPHYRCWFLPIRRSLQCCEYVDNEVVEHTEDPR